MRSRTERAAHLAQARRRGSPRISKSGVSRDELADIELEAQRWMRLAPAFGFCSHCGASIDEANGKLHDEGCIPSQPERCRKGQRT